MKTLSILVLLFLASCSTTELTSEQKEDLRLKSQSARLNKDRN